MVLGGIYGLTRYWWDLPIWGAITIALAGLAAILFGLYVLFWYLLARSIR
jgi:hypothetical protein